MLQAVLRDPLGKGDDPFLRIDPGPVEVGDFTAPLPRQDQHLDESAVGIALSHGRIPHLLQLDVVQDALAGPAGA